MKRLSLGSILGVLLWVTVLGTHALCPVNASAADAPIDGTGVPAPVTTEATAPASGESFIGVSDAMSSVLGATAGLVVLVCFCIITWRGLRIASRAPDTFGAFLALGLTTMVAIQALVNISVVLGLMPTKGIPLPFVSAGGSSLIINLLGMGVLLNVSRHASTAA